LGTRFSLFYSESENFDPAATGRIDPLTRPIDPPSGVTKDYGIRINTLEGKLELKLNFFETGLVGQSFTGGLTGIAITELDIRFRELTYFAGVNAGYINPNDPVLSAFGTPPEAVLSAANARLTPEGIYTFSGQGRITDTTDTSGEGMEVEVVYNPLPGWRMIFNVARQETVQTNSLRGLQDYIALRLPEWQAAFNYPRGLLSATELATPGVRGPDGFINPAAFAAAFPNRTREADFNERLRLPLQAILDTDGGVVSEQREWRFNLATNYTFSKQSWFKGFNVGGAIRWQDRAAIGNPRITNADGQVIVDVDHPYFGPKQVNYDAWIGYRRALRNGKVDWKVQLNVRNLFSDDDPVPVTKDAFGRNSQYILPPLTTWAVTNTFSF
jgi:hypothetical protein